MAKHRHKQIVCPNCDYAFKGIDNFCPNCGQENRTHRLPLKHYLLELVESYFHFDTKMLNTVRDLVIKPGLITKNYNENKRARYVPPIRFYVFISFVFFLLYAIQKPDEKTETSKNNLNITFEALDNKADSADFEKLTQKPELSNAEMAHFLDSIGVKTHWYSKGFYYNALKIRTGHYSSELFYHKLGKSFSALMFLLMPLFAFYLGLFHIKQKRFYSENLVFSIHLHSVAFLFLITGLIMSYFLPNTIFVILFLPGLYIYMLLATKKVYGQSYKMAGLKTFFLGVLHFLTLLIIGLLAIVISLV